MKLLPCELIRDVLPLYHDGVCSGVTKTLVEEHLKGCPDCARAREKMEGKLTIPELEVDAAKPLKSIKKKWNTRKWLTGIGIGVGVFLAVFAVWFSLTQNCSVPMTAEEIRVEGVYRLSNGMYYMEYSYPYSLWSFCADICRTEDGEIHITQYRPRMPKKLDEGSYTTKSYLIDPENNVLYTDGGAEVPLRAFYLGCPDEGEAVLLWSADMEVGAAGPEVEAKCEGHFVMR